MTGTKKDIIGDLKKFNKDLDKHFPNLDLESIRDLKITNREEDSEYFALLANNLMDLRTEMALTRKNLSTDVEGMVVRVISEEQQKFFEQIKKFYGVVMIEMKDNFMGQVKMINDEMNSLKRKYGDVGIQNERMQQVLEEVSTELKKVDLRTEDARDEAQMLDSFVKSRFDVLFDKLKLMDNDMSKIKEAVGDNLNHIDRKIARVENSLREIRENTEVMSYDQLLRKASLQESRSQSTQDDFPDEERRLDDIKEENLEKQEKLRKIAEIDKKLDKLSSLKKSSL